MNIYYALFFIFTYAVAIDLEDITNVSVNIAQSSYCVDSTLNWNCHTCYDSNILSNVIEKNGEQVIFGYNTDYKALFIAFRGSSNIQNWLDNIQFSHIQPYDDQTISVEKGFYNLFSSLKPTIYNTLLPLSEKYGKDIIVTGHSLGGALATLFAFDNEYNDMEYNILSIVTFGSPRVGNHDFVTKFNEYNVYSKRITHYRDIVPHVPQNMLGYYHIPNEIWYNEDNTNYSECNDTTYPFAEDSTCSDSCAPTHCTSTSDHTYYLNVTMGSSGC
jgi:hypothetical protein